MLGEATNQQVTSTVDVDVGPPPIDAVRPPSCQRCGRVAGAKGVKLMHGHGCRQRIVALSRPGAARAELLRIWVRRFRCRACGGTRTVLPPGVLRRYLYALASILRAFWLAIPPPLGAGLADVAVYAQVGVDRLSRDVERHRTGRRRWRSLARWASKLTLWWPTAAIAGTSWRSRTQSLLTGFVAVAGGAQAAVVEAGLARHVGRGAPV